MLSPKRVHLLAVAALLLAACAAQDLASDSDGDLGLGDPAADESKDDGYGSALTCKTGPDYPALAAPRITISLDGLTLHLVDDAGDYDKAFPIGAGKIASSGSGRLESHSYYPVIANHTHDFEIIPSRDITACRVWWTDPATGGQSPVFAGLPFMRWDGPYAIHGPIDNYKAPNGGNLRRGFVSHGCIRMEAADVLEVYARIRHAARIPVHVQREVDRYADGRRVDVADKWIGAECTSDAECNYEGGMCVPNAVGGRGYCSKTCTTSCPDKANYPTTFCADLGDADGGRCVPRVGSQNYDCRPYDSLVAQTVTRPGGGITANACIPGSRGFIGDRCTDTDGCDAGLNCAEIVPGAPRVCTKACTTTCPDQPGSTATFCAIGVDGGTCVRGCTADSGIECAEGFACVAETAAAGGTAYGCEPAVTFN
jgi:hypothetical protein